MLRVQNREQEANSMNAKQTEAATGISRRNLRFYEDQGLIHPHRKPGNDYRD